MSVVLLVGAGLFVRSLVNVRAVPLGYDPAPILEVTPDFRGEEGDSLSRALRCAGDCLRRRRPFPGVEYATRFKQPTLRDQHRRAARAGHRLGREARPLQHPARLSRLPSRCWGRASCGGRRIEERDRQGAPPVAVVSQAMAAVLWPGKEALGQCIQVAWSGAESAPCTTVVGIAENTAQQNLNDDPRYAYYLPVEQMAPHESAALLLRMRDRNAGFAAGTGSRRADEGNAGRWVRLRAARCRKWSTTRAGRGGLARRCSSPLADWRSWSPSWGSMA